jgi:hypothetical protein
MTFSKLLRAGQRQAQRVSRHWRAAASIEVGFCGWDGRSAVGLMGERVTDVDEVSAITEANPALDAGHAFVGGLLVFHATYGNGTAYFPGLARSLRASD